MHEVRATKPRGTSAEAQAQKKIALCAPISPPINLHNLTFSPAWRVALRKKARTTACDLNFACWYGQKRFPIPIPSLDKINGASFTYLV